MPTILWADLFTPDVAGAVTFYGRWLGWSLDPSTDRERLLDASGQGIASVVGTQQTCAQALTSSTTQYGSQCAL
ncbi:MAG: hypothetical protein AAFQ53_00135, partial [Bacteroidota bacterium]